MIFSPGPDGVPLQRYMATKNHCNDNDTNVDSTINMEVMDIMVVLAMTIFVDKVKMVLLMLITSNSNCF